ncbi:MAG: multicopper oxidase family protein [Nocardioidaceae bacterium]|nr:multicopper oxidase family protein [Nocardioidaceae bacterium]
MTVSDPSPRRELRVDRRGLFRGAVGLGGLATVGTLAACSAGRTGTDSSAPAAGTGGLVAPDSAAVAAAERARRVPGRSTVAAHLTVQPSEIDLGGRTVSTWTYGDSVPGPLLRATAGDVLDITVDNRLPTDTSVHWHGIALRNDMDGVPGITQDPIKAGSAFRYTFTAPDPGTYFFHPHTGVQLDRGLYGVLVLDDPREPGAYDDEWVIVLDDWIDGTGRTPDDVLKQLTSSGGSSGMNMSGMNMSGMNMSGMGGGMGESYRSPLLGGAGDVNYPLYLVNGRTPEAPHVFTGRPGQRIRLRIVNAGSDTAFRLAVGAHRLTVTHTDGFPVQPVSTDALLIGMGERFDATLELGDGVFPLVAEAEGKNGRAMAVIRTAAGARPPVGVDVPQLRRRILLGTDLNGLSSVALDDRAVDRTYDVALGGSMARYHWTINGKTFPDSDPLPVAQGERVGLRLLNHTMMFHPVHLHGHTFEVAGTGLRKDTLIVRPMQRADVVLDADNPGQWALHCHNIYHAETGMMTTMSYQS